MFKIAGLKQKYLSDELVKIRKNLIDLGYVGMYQDYNPLKREAGMEFMAFRDEGGKVYLRADLKRLGLSERIKKYFKRKKTVEREVFCKDVEEETGAVFNFFLKNGYRKYGEENFACPSSLKKKKIVMKKGDLFFGYYVEVVNF